MCVLCRPRLHLRITPTMSAVTGSGMGLWGSMLCLLIFMYLG